MDDETIRDAIGRVNKAMRVAEMYRQRAEVEPADLRTLLAALDAPVGDERERVARALATRRGSTVVQKAHKLDADAAIAAMREKGGAETPPSDSAAD